MYKKPIINKDLIAGITIMFFLPLLVAVWAANNGFAHTVERFCFMAIILPMFTLISYLVHYIQSVEQPLQVILSHEGKAWLVNVQLSREGEVVAAESEWGVEMKEVDLPWVSKLHQAWRREVSNPG